MTGCAISRQCCDMVDPFIWSSIRHTLTRCHFKFSGLNVQAEICRAVLRQRPKTFRVYSLATALGGFIGRPSILHGNGGKDDHVKH